MTNEQAREVFNAAANAAAKRGDRDALAKIELAREYFTRKGFSQALAGYLWETRK